MITFAFSATSMSFFTASFELSVGPVLGVDVALERRVVSFDNAADVTRLLIELDIDFPRIRQN
jgi:hypothetical protein